MPRPEFDEFESLLHEQAKTDPVAVEAFEYYARMQDSGYNVTHQDAGAYALAGTVVVSGKAFEASVERIAGLASLLYRARHD